MIPSIPKGRPKAQTKPVFPFLFSTLTTDLVVIILTLHAPEHGNNPTFFN